MAKPAKVKKMIAHPAEGADEAVDVELWLLSKHLSVQLQQILQRNSTYTIKITRGLG